MSDIFDEIRKKYGLAPKDPPKSLTDELREKYGVGVERTADPTRTYTHGPDGKPGQVVNRETGRPVAMQITADAPSDIELGLAKAMRPDLAAQSTERKPVDTTKDVVTQSLRGLAESGYGTAQGMGNIIAKVSPFDADKQAAENIRTSRNVMRETYGEADTGAGIVANIGAQFLGAGAQFMAPGAALGRAGQMGGLLGKVQGAIKAGGTKGVLAEAGVGLATTAPLDAVISQSPEDALATGLGEMMDNDRLRQIGREGGLPSAALEVGVGAAAGGLVDGVRYGLAARAARRVPRTIDEAVQQRPMLALPASTGAGEGPAIPMGPATTGPLAPAQRLLPASTPQPRSTDLHGPAIPAQGIPAPLRGIDGAIPQPPVAQPKLLGAGDGSMHVPAEPIPVPTGTRGPLLETRAGAGVPLDLLASLFKEQNLPGAVVRGAAGGLAGALGAEATGNDPLSGALLGAGSATLLNAGLRTPVPRTIDPKDLPGRDPSPKWSIERDGYDREAIRRYEQLYAPKLAARQALEQNLAGTAGGALAGAALDEENRLRGAAAGGAIGLAGARALTKQDGVGLSTVNVGELPSSRANVTASVEAVPASRFGFSEAFAGASKRANRLLTRDVEAALKDADGVDVIDRLVEHVAGPAWRGRVRTTMAEGMYEGGRQPTTVMEFDIDTPNHVIEKIVAVKALVQGQNAAPWWKPRYDAAPDGEKLVTGHTLSAPDAKPLPKATIDELVSIIQSTPHLKPLDGATISNGQAFFLWNKYTGVDQAQYERLLDDAIARVQSVPDIDRRIATYESGYIDGAREQVAHVGRDPESLRQIRGILAERLKPVYERHAGKLGPDAAAQTRARIDERIAALDALDGQLTNPPLRGESSNTRRTVVEAARDLASTIVRAHGAPALRKAAATPESRLAHRVAVYGDALDSAKSDWAKRGDWYDGEMDDLDAIATLTIPELRDPSTLGLFHAVAAVLSNGQRVQRNIEAALHVMEQFTQTGKLTRLDPDASQAGLRTSASGQAKQVFSGKPGRGVGGEVIRGHPRGNVHEQQLRGLQALIDERGIDGALKHLEGTTTLRNGRVVPNSIDMLGPKLGQFFLDLRRKNSTGSTVDMWMKRLDDAAFGRVVEGRKDGRAQLDDKPTPEQMREIQQAVEELARQRGLTPRDVQSSLWDEAKLQYRSHGAVEDADAYATFGSAATTFATRHAMLRAAIGMGAGAATGAAVDSDNRLRGAALGATMPIATTRSIKQMLKAASEMKPGTWLFDHYSHVDDLTELDPKFMGTGKAGEEAKRASRIPANHVYVAGAKPEPQLKGLKKYQVELTGKIYNANEDPLGVVAKSRNSYGAFDANKMEKLIRDAGFDGYFVPDLDPTIVKLFHKVPVKGAAPASPEQAVRYAPVAREPKGAVKSRFVAAPPRMIDVDGNGRKIDPRKIPIPTSPQFKAWFGNSKIVENGDPMVVMHGTPELDYHTFKKGDVGYHFGTSQQARTRAEALARPGAPTRIIPAFIRMEKPLRLDADPNNWTGGTFMAALERTGAFSEDDLAEMAVAKSLMQTKRGYSLQSDADRAKPMRDLLKKHGYDGIIYPNEVEGGGVSYIVFDANQIKHAVDNSGAFSNATGNMLKAAVGTAGGAAAGELVADDPMGGAMAGAGVGFVKGNPRWYSRLARAIDAAPFRKGTAQQWAAAIQKNVAKGEREWVGIDKWLAENEGRVLTQDEVREAFTSGEIKLTERVSGDNQATPGNRLYRDSYSMPGGENYREVRVMLDGRDAKPRHEVAAAAESYLRMRGYSDDVIRQRDGDDVIEWAESEGWTPPQGDHFKQAHFPDDKDVLFHLRLKDYTNDAGEKVLHVDEIQSDWHQKGRKQGYKGDPVDTKGWTATPGDGDPASGPVWEVRNEKGRWMLGIPTATAPTPEQAILRAAENAERSEFGNRVPNAPYKKTDEWVGLAWRRVIDEAVAGGYDRVSWVRGDQAVDRFDLSSEVDALQWDPAKNEITGWKDGEDIFERTLDDPSELDELIGAELAEKLRTQQPDASGQIILDGEGGGLKVGGDGMKAFYDGMVPKVARDYAKKLGIKLDIDETNLGATKPGASPKLMFAQQQRGIAEGVLEEAEHVLRKYESGEIKDGGPFPDTMYMPPRWESRATLEADIEHHKGVIAQFDKRIAEEVSKLALSQPSFSVKPFVEPVKTRGQYLYSTPVGPAIDEATKLAGKAARKIIDPKPATPRTPGSHKDELADDHFRFDKVTFDADGEDALRERVERVVRERGLDPKKVITWEETLAEAERVGMDPAALYAKLKSKNVSRAHMVAARQLIADNTALIAKRARELEKGGLGQGTRERLEAELAALNTQTDQLVAAYSPGRSEAGRLLNSFKIVANLNLDPAAWYARGSKIAGGRSLTDSEREAIAKLIADGDRNGLAKYVVGLKDVHPARKYLDTAINLRRIGLLTGLRTHGINISSNFLLNVAEQAKDIPAAFMDAALSAISGRATKDLNVVRSIEASRRGAVQGIKDAKKILKSGTRFDDGTRKWDHVVNEDIDLPGVPEAVNRALTKYVQVVGRTLSAEDRVFNRMAFQRSLEEIAAVSAKNEGLTGKAARARTKEKLAAPSMEMILSASHDAMIATLQDPNALARVAKAVQKGLGPIGEYFLPFTQAPSSIAMRAIEYSPVGFAMSGTSVAEFIGLIRKAGRTPEQEKALMDLQKLASDRFGRASAGTVAMMVGAYLVHEGLLSSGRPAVEQDRDTREAMGIGDGGLKVGDSWHRVSHLAPVGALVMAGAAWQRALTDEEGGKGRAAIAAGATIGKSIADSPFLTGVSDMKELVDDPERRALRWGQSQVGSFVPTLASDIAKTVDPVLRRGDGVLDGAKARIPGLSRTVAPKIDAMGDTVKLGGGPLGRGSQMVDFTQPRDDKRGRDPVLQALSDLDIPVSRPRANKTLDETPEQLRQRQIEAGKLRRQNVRDAIGKTNTTNLTPQQREDLTEDVLRALRDADREALREQSDRMGVDLRDPDRRRRRRAQYNP